ncbi:MAG: hypothetical protein KBF97_01925 [Bacteroidetes bacterium]|nr:hypothetical protein [Bacteroidota bacterium]
MSGSIERTSAPTFVGTGIRISIIFIFVLGSILLYQLRLLPIHSINLRQIVVNIIPSVSAAGLTVHQGIAEFSGTPLPAAESGTFGTIFLLLCAYFVLVPVTYFSLREQQQRTSTTTSKRTFLFTAPLIVVGTVAILVPTLIAGTFYGSTKVISIFRQDMEHSRYVQTVVRQCASIAFATRQFAARSVSEGGGGGSFRTPKGMVTLAGLGIPEQTKEGRAILVSTESDTVLTLLFIGNKAFPPEQGSSNTDLGTVIYKTEIHPTFHRTRPLQ